VAARRVRQAVPPAKEDLPWPTDAAARNEKFSALFSKAGFNVVENPFILMEFVVAPHGTLVVWTTN
jgi:hypothetical protein